MPKTRRSLALACLALASLTAPAAADSDDPELMIDLDAGRRAYERCAVCHRDDGGGRPDGTFPKIAGQHRSVVAAELASMRDGTRPNPVMEPHARALLDEEEVEAVAAYVASLTPPAERGLGPGEELERGERLYRNDCVSCHGPSGQGDAERLVPVMAGQHYAYLLRRVRNLASWREARHPQTERPLDEYTDAELRAVVDYAARLSDPEPAASP